MKKFKQFVLAVMAVPAEFVSAVMAFPAEFASAAMAVLTEFASAAMLIPVAIAAKVGIMSNKRRMYENAMKEGRRLVAEGDSPTADLQGLRGLRSRRGEIWASTVKTEWFHALKLWIAEARSPMTPGWISRYDDTL